MESGNLNGTKTDQPKFEDIEQSSLIEIQKGFAAALLGENEITNDITFQLFTHKNPDTPTKLSVNETLDSHDFNQHDPWKFLIHGWTTSPKSSPWFSIYKEQYFKRGAHNVVYVDWSKPANESYYTSANNSRGSGKHLASFLANLKKNNVSMDKIHLLGHSLGAQMAGFAGKYLFEMTGEKIHRLSATDPAGPLFEFPILLPECARLSEKDAMFVDVIHTDAGRFGMWSSVGHVDFFPNGGKRLQPGCEHVDDENCSHARSTLLYGESITSQQFIARKCRSYEEYTASNCKNNTMAIFGEDLDPSLRGNFYFTTNSESPFARGDQITH